MGVGDGKLNKCISTSNIMERKPLIKDSNYDTETLIHQKMTVLSEVVKKEQ